MKVQTKQKQGKGNGGKNNQKFKGENQVNKKKFNKKNNAGAQKIQNAVKSGEIEVKKKGKNAPLTNGKNAEKQDKAKAIATSPAGKNDGKRKQLSEAGAKNKKQKMEKFQGIKMSTNEGAKEKGKNKPQAQKQNEQKDTKAKQVQSANKKNEKNAVVKEQSEASKKFQKRKQRFRGKRLEQTEKLRKLSEDAKQGNKQANETLKAMLADLIAKPKSHTMSRKIRRLKNLLGIKNKSEENDNGKPATKVNKKLENKNKKPQKNQNITAPKKADKPKPLVVSKDEEEESSSSESDYNVETNIKAEKITKGMNEFQNSSDEEGESVIVPEDQSGLFNVSHDDDDNENESDEDGGDESDNEDENEDDDADEDDEEETDVKSKNKQPKKLELTKKIEKILSSGGQKNKESPDSNSKKVRYVVFVGNLPFTSNSETIKEHFTRAGDVKSVRIPLDSKTNRPRGFAYVEFSTSVEYEKALSMQNTFIEGRKINVSYTKSGSKKGEDRQKEIKAKNFKLKAMRNAGKLAGSQNQNQKRTARRAWKNKNESKH